MFETFIVMMMCLNALAGIEGFRTRIPAQDTGNVMRLNALAGIEGFRTQPNRNGNNIRDKS